MLVLLLTMLFASLLLFWSIFSTQERISPNIDNGKLSTVGNDAKYISASVGVGRKIKFKKGTLRIRSNTR